MNNSQRPLNTPLSGGPEFYGLRLRTPDDVTHWITTTPQGEDPTEHMTDVERDAFKAATAPIGSLSVDEQQMFYRLVRNGRTLQEVRDIASYDSI